MTTVPDLLRLLAVPAFGWIAYRDYRTRRVPGRAWYPLVALGVALLVWDAAVALGRPPPGPSLFFLRAGVSLGLLIPMAYGFWWLGGFGAADAKAFVVIALLFPVAPTYEVGPVVLPLQRPPLAVFSLTIVTDAVLVGLFYPVALAVRNAIRGRVSPAMFVGRPVPWDSIPGEHGRLLQSPDGFTRDGLDLDALRMYLRWRGADLAAVRDRPGDLRDPASLPDEPSPPTDGAPDAGDPIVDGGHDDPWGAAAFLESIEGNAYGTTPDQLREGLEVLAAEDVVWISPGIPFLVPLFVGLVVALVYGDVLFAALSAVDLPR